jgi:PD-(D/E)XK nuclease superfamily
VIWNPLLGLIGDHTVLKVSASDVSSTSPCGRFLAIKVRPDVHSPAWTRSFPRDNVFPLGDLVELVAAAHRAPEAASHLTQRQWLAQQFDDRGIHRLLRPYLERAVENVLEAHEAIEDELGPLRLLVVNPFVGRRPRQLTAWAPLYQTDDGVREIRRYRLGSAHDEPADEDAPWAATAGYVAATFGVGVTPTRVRVVELGAVDGSIAVLFDGDPETAVAGFQANGKARASDLTAQDHVVPCRDCGTCKIAGVCEALVPVTGLLGQAKPGYRSRSIAPSALDQYRICPAQWLLDRELHLPREKGTSEAQARGQAVHQWLKVAHRRSVRCRSEDLPEPGGELGLAAGQLSAEEYAVAYPYLVQHLQNCPLGKVGIVVVAVEKDVYGFDHDAQVIPVTKPDLIYRLGERLVAREFKTAADLPAHGKDEAYSQHLQIPFLLTMLASGLAERHGAVAGTVELELLTASGSELWSWDTDHLLTARVAAGDVRRAVDDWHRDDTWNTRPGQHCTWCPVREWCPDRDMHIAGLPGRSSDSTGDPTGSAADEPPPF